MKKFAVAIAVICLIVVVSYAQSGRKTRPRVVKKPKPAPISRSGNPSKRAAKTAPELLNASSKQPPSLQSPATKTTETNKPEPDEEDGEVIQIDTNLVTLPVAVLDRNGRFITGVGQNEFEVYDNGIAQKIEHFVTVEKPFTVVLLLDVSPSTRYDMDEIQRAAFTFVNQLRSDDKVMVVAFDYGYQLLVHPTSDKNEIRKAIYRARWGGGTSLYEAVSNTIKRELSRVEGRKAVVLFTDGVDTMSSRAGYHTTIRQVEEIDALFYPIRYNTFNSFAGRINAIQMRRGQTGNVRTGKTSGIRTAGNKKVSRDGTSRVEYHRGKAYLSQLARSSGGRMFEADTTANLDSAFRNIADELRKQYWIGYYPEDTGSQGELRNVRVRVTRPNLAVRTKNRYIVGKGNRLSGRKSPSSEEPDFFKRRND